MSRAHHSIPAWVEQLNEDVIVKDTEDSSWFSGGYLGMPTRYHNEVGYLNAYDTGYHKGHRDDLSLRTRSTITDRRRRRTSCCLVLFLVLAALIVAVGIGIMMYYLLKPETGKYRERIANGSLPLLNVPYTQDMQDKESDTFKDLEKSLCQKIDTFFEGSVYADQYDHCKVDFLTVDDSPIPCACSNITNPTNPENAKAYFNIVFRGDVHRQMVHTILEKHIQRVVGLDYDVLLLDKYIIDIESHLALTTTTAISPPDVGVRANLTIWVYNMTYTSDLADRNSEDFKALASPFCNDLRRMFLSSELQSRYHSCRVQNFSHSPDIVVTDVWFTGAETSHILSSLKQIVLNGARKVNVSGQVRKMIGTLLITPSSGNGSTITVITIPLNPESTISPTPSTRPPNWTDGMPYIELMLNFTGVDLNSTLFDRGSQYFTFHANKFCKELERMILQSAWKQNYYDCNMLNIYPPESGKMYPYLRSVIHVTSNTDTPSILVDIIRNYAEEYTFPGDLQTFKVGDLYVILTDGRYSIYSTSYAPHTTISFSTETTIYPSTFTLFSFSTPKQTGTAIPPVSTIVIEYNATAAFIESHLVDFTYTQDLMVSTSKRFMTLEKLFCDDIDAFFAQSSLRSYYKMCKISWFSSDPKFSFVLHFNVPKGDYLQTAVPSVIIDKAPKAQIGSYTVLRIGSLNLLYDALGFTVSATNYTMDGTPTIFPTETVTVTATITPPEYSATLVNIVCDVVSDIIPSYEDRSTNSFRLLESAFCKDISKIFTNDQRTAKTYLDCYILQFSSDMATVQFHAVFAEDATEEFGGIVLDMVHMLSEIVQFEQAYHMDIGGVIVESYSCRMNVYPVNYTDPKTTMFTTLTPTSQIVLPTAGFQHCLREPCKNGGTCTETLEFYTCHCAQGFTGQNCEFDIDECSVLTEACENGGTCINILGGYDCLCYQGYMGDRCETVIDRCASSPCRNGGKCTGSPQQLCICTGGWKGSACEEDVDECSILPNVCVFNGTCTNTFGSFTCECVSGRTGPTCNQGIDECEELEPCQNGAACYDTDYSYTCVCAQGWTGDHCTDDVDECRDGICQNGGVCKNTFGGFECTCTSGWTGKTCNTRYDECEGVNPCQHDGICVDTSSHFKCLCKKGWTGEFCEIDINECLDASTCNGHGECENLDGGFKCICDMQWEGQLCDLDHDECSDTSLGQLCFNNGECINQWGSYKCNCQGNWTGSDCKIDIDECLQDPPICLHDGICTNELGGFKCACTIGRTGSRCQLDVDECLTSPCKNNGTCTNKVGSFFCNCGAGWRGQLCEEDIDECTETPGVCRNGGTCINKLGDYSCICPEGRGGKNCDYSTDPCSSIQCAHGGKCYIETSGDPKCNCTEQFTGEFCNEDFNECTNDPCINGICQNVFGTFYCDCYAGFTGELCDEDDNECSFYQCVHGYCNNTVGSFKCICEDGWEGQFCNIDITECSLLGKPCNGNGRCEETPGSYKCICYIGYEGQFCQDDFDECSEVTCENGGVCENYMGGFECKCSQFWTGSFCTIDINECTTMATPCLNGGRCSNRDLGYDCVCTDQWKGDTCQEDVNECEVTPDICMNNGLCINNYGGYSCSCAQGFEGERCQLDVNECEVTPDICMNNGLCINNYGGYSCSCAQGFEGERCQFDINECLLSPCQNNGVCQNTPPGDYTCVCTDGWTGKNCTSDKDECVVNPCQNNGVCLNDPPGQYTCSCTSGWTGRHCDIDVNECLANTCQNNGVCTNTPPGDYTCTCIGGWTGKQCETDINECLANPCQNSAVCQNTPPGTYTCVCTEGWTGKDCRIDINECLTKPCQNNGVCTNNPPGNYTCTCTGGWTGRDCHIDINECLNNPCKNNAVCENTPPGDYTCTCTGGWKGKHCELDIDECSMNICQNNGVCQNSDGSYTCTCTNGWTGKDCQIDVDECLANPCQNNGVCTNTPPGDYTCSCGDSWTGKDCQIEVERCPDCQNGGICVNENGNFRCVCASGWQGSLCETDINECLPTNPCQNGGTCTNEQGTFKCTCMAGYEGDTCQIDFNECISNPCRYGGTCIDGINLYTCECPAGRDGIVCQNDVNECLATPSPCKNGGTCTNTDGSFTCTCGDSWTGQTCETDKNECEMITCEHGGSCVNTEGSFMCESCDNGWEGQLCHIDINECEAASGNPCENGGTCINKDGTFECECTDGWRGLDCTIDVNECEEYGPLACYENGNCTNTDGDYTCSCSSGYTGLRCENDIDECADNPGLCMNGGTCIDYLGTYKCDCKSGFEGQHCEKDIDECNIGICIHAASCLNAFGTYKCTCLPGWNGTNCDIDIDECLSGTLCQNGGICVNTDGSFTCSCTPGWVGPLCETVGSNTFELEFETVGLTITPDLLNTQSDAFIEKQFNLCNDVYNFATTYLVPYESCNIVAFKENPNGLTLRLAFNDDFPSQIGATQIKDLLFENREKIRFDDVYGIRVGDMVFKHSDFISTDVAMSKRLVNFTYTLDLSNENSLAFQKYESAFCSDVNGIMTANPITFPNYVSCDVTAIRRDTQTDGSIVDFNFEFEWTQDAAAITTNFDEYIDINLPKVYFDQFETARIGDFFMYIRDMPNYTRVPISYTLLDVEWNQELANKGSTLFQQHSSAFCEEISDLINQHATFSDSYGSCAVQKYSEQLTDPFLVNVDIALELYEMLNMDEVRSELSGIIYNTAQRERYNDFIGLRVSDLVLYDSIAVYFEIPYDGWIVNFTFSLFDYSSYKPTLLDPTSADFKSKQKAFCEGDSTGGVYGLEPYIDQLFYGSRFLQCFVHSYTFDELSVSDSLTSTVSLLFFGTEPVLSEELVSIIEKDFVSVPVGGDGDYYFIGYDLVKIREIDEIKVNISDYITGEVTTTPLPEIADTLTMRFPLLNFTSYEDFQNTSTLLYKNSSEWFCNDMKKMFDATIDDLPKYAGCGGLGFTKESNQTYLTFELDFHQVIQNETLAVSQLLRVITEKGKRATLPDSTVAIVLGPFMVYQDSLQPIITNPEIFRTPAPTPSKR